MYIRIQNDTVLVWQGARWEHAESNTKRMGGNAGSESSDCTLLAYCPVLVCTRMTLLIICTPLQMISEYDAPHCGSPQAVYQILLPLIYSLNLTPGILTNLLP